MLTPVPGDGGQRLEEQSFGKDAGSMVDPEGQGFP